MDAPSDPFTGLSAPWAALARRGIIRRYPKHVVLIQEGDRGDTLFILLSGSVKAYSTDEREREIIYGTYGPGECMGEMSLDGGPRSASVITLEPTRCAVITRETLKAHIVAEPPFAFELIDRVIRRARAQTENARGLALLDVYGRLARLLNKMAVASTDGLRVIEPPPKQRDLASWTGASREMVGKLLKGLFTRGYVRPELPNRWVIARPLPRNFAP